MARASGTSSLSVTKHGTVFGAAEAAAHTFSNTRRDTTLAQRTSGGVALGVSTLDAQGGGVWPISGGLEPAWIEWGTSYPPPPAPLGVEGEGREQ